MRAVKKALRWVVLLARDVCTTLAWLAGNPEAWMAVAIAGVLLSGCAAFGNPTAEAMRDLSSPRTLAALCAAGADTAECRK